MPYGFSEYLDIVLVVWIWAAYELKEQQIFRQIHSVFQPDQ